MAVLLPNSCAGYSGRLIPMSVDRAVPAVMSVTLKYTGTADVNVLTSIGVITQIQMSQQVAAQFQNALTDVIYVTPFGDKADTINMTFIANRLCESINNRIRVIDHYLNYRLLPGSETSAIPATIAVGGASFRAYLVGMVLRGDSSQQLVTGSLVFQGWPA